MRAQRLLTKVRRHASTATRLSAIVAVTTAALVVPSAVAVHAAAAGSIVYVRDGNIWLARPDGSGQRAITTDGSPADPYEAPSESDDGTIAAFRNQPRHDDRGNTYLLGEVSIFNRAGALMMPPFVPEQFKLIPDGPCPGPVLEEPAGLYDLEISPDGHHLAYTAIASLENAACDGAGRVAGSYVSSIDGSAPQTIASGGNDPWTFFENPTWVSNARVVVVGDVAAGQSEWTYDVGAAGAVEWFEEPFDSSITAYREPTLSGTELATDGYVSTPDGQGAYGIEFWSGATPGTGRPTERCQITGTAAFNAPTWSPDGASLLYENTEPDNQGIWIATIPGMTTGQCAGTDTKLISNGQMPFWGRAPYDLAPIAVPAPPPTSPAGPTGSSYAPLVPARLYESRNEPGLATIDGQQFATGARSAGSITEVHVAGRAGVPADAAAVVVNVTATNTQSPGFLTVFPCGTPTPNASNVNYSTNTTIPNAVIAKIGTNGNICVFTYATTDLIIDVNGYYPSGSSYAPLVPARLYESRNEPGLATIDGQQFATGARSAGSITEVHVAGRAGVPADAAAVVVNVTATNTQSPGFLTVFPCGTPTPNASNVNYSTNTTIPNAVIAKIGTNGNICVFTYATTDLIIDVNGYYPSGK